MLRVINCTDKASLSRLLRARETSLAEAEKVAGRILQDVRRNGDRALVRLSRRFDGVDLRKDGFTVTRQEIRAAYRQVPRGFVGAVRVAARNIRAAARRQLPRPWKSINRAGVKLSQIVRPLERVACYVPGGRFPLPSTVLMSVIPAQVAGVREVFVTSPRPAPAVLVAADLLGVKKIFRLGGAQAIAAFAYGTESVPRVDKIVGPGNIYVATAKRLLYGTVGIDMVAGPSELLVVADGDAKPAHVAADLLCEAEHDEDAQVYLVTTSAQLAKDVVQLIGSQLKGLQREKIAAKSIARHSVAFVVTTMDEAIDVANEIAPEHLTLSVDEPFDYLEKIRHAGALFLGRYTPPSVADYVAGPNHVLPTGGTARFFSALSVHDYIKVSNIVHYTKEELSKVKDHLVRLAHIEGFDAHAKSAQSRFS